MEIKISDNVNEDFFDVAQKVYGEDEIWVPESQKWIINTVNKYDSKVMIGYVDNVPTSRVVLFLKKGETWLGFFEAVSIEDGLELLKQVDQFCIKEKILTIIGPKTDNLVQGLLVKGFDLPQTILTNYNPKYYGKIFRKSKYKKLTKMITVQFSKKSVRKPKTKNYDVEIRTFNLNELKRETKIFHDLQNEIFSSHKGWEVRTLDEDKELIESFLPMIDPDLILIAQVKNKPIGILICLPDINQKLKGNKIDNARIISIGVIPDYSRKGIGLLMGYRIMETLLKKGYKTAEASWILKTNLPPQLLCKRFNAKLGKKYVLFSKQIKL